MLITILDILLDKLIILLMITGFVYPKKNKMQLVLNN